MQPNCRPKHACKRSFGFEIEKVDDTVEQPVAMPGMEVKTMLQERIMAQYRGLHPLDRVILEARKREETELAEAAAAKELVAQEESTRGATGAPPAPDTGDASPAATPCSCEVA